MAMPGLAASACLAEMNLLAQAISAIELELAERQQLVKHLKEAKVMIFTHSA